MYTISVTGHRYLTSQQQEKLHAYFHIALGKYLEEYRDKLKCISGMAIGVDTIFARIAIDLGIPLIAAVPFSGQSGWAKEVKYSTLEKKNTNFKKLHQKAWPTQHMYVYFDLLDKAEKVVYVDNTKGYTIPGLKPGIYHPSKYQKRNEFMMDNADHVIAVFDGRLGGTQNCLKYAKRIGISRDLINPKEL